MSCCIVSEKDIALLTEAIYHYKIPGVSRKPDALGHILWEENHQSYNYRYHDNVHVPVYIHYGCPQVLVENALLVYKQVRHYCYQSCEHAGWDQSEAWRLMDALEQVTCTQLGITPEQASRCMGWNDLPWGL